MIGRARWPSTASSRNMSAAVERAECCSPATAVLDHPLGPARVGPEHRAVGVVHHPKPAASPRGRSAGSRYGRSSRKAPAPPPRDRSGNAGSRQRAPRASLSGSGRARGRPRAGSCAAAPSDCAGRRACSPGSAAHWSSPGTSPADRAWPSARPPAAPDPAPTRSVGHLEEPPTSGRFMIQ